MEKSRRSNLNSVIVIIILSILVIAVFLLLFVNFGFIGKKSIHEDAKKYMTRHCLAFYPDSKQGFSFAKDLCKGEKNDTIYDYTLVPYGDYYLVNYGMDKMRFGQAVVTGSRVRLVASLHNIQNLRGICKAEVAFTIEIENQRKPALEGIASFLYYFK